MTKKGRQKKKLSTKRRKAKSLKKKVRQEKVKGLMIRGLNIGEIAKTLHVSYKTIERDLEEIREGILLEIKRQPLSKVLSEFLLAYDAVYREAWARYYAASNDSAKVGALNLLNKMFLNRIKVLQALGVLQVVPEKLEVSGEFDVSLKKARKLLLEMKKKKGKE